MSTQVEYNAQAAYERWYMANVPNQGQITRLKGMVDLSNGLRQLADGTILTTEAIAADWKATMYARYQAMAPFGSGQAQESDILCDLCGLTKPSFGMRYEEGIVRFCQDCAAPPVFEAPYKRPWWLRALKWLGRL